MQELAYWIWLSRIENVGKKRIFDLLQRYKTPEKLWNASKEELISLGISEKKAEKITKIEYKQNLDKYIEYMRKTGIHLITINSEYYPYALKNIYDPPIAIYVKGNKEILNNFAIAIVGCRKASKYGEDISKNFAYELSKANINIISGGARGIDTCSHLRSAQSNR